MSTHHPSLYQVNTRVWLNEWSGKINRKATLDDIPDEELDQWAERGFSWIWLLSVWETGMAARQISRSHPGWRKEFGETLIDLQEEDIPGSGFAINRYTVSETVGGEQALTRFRNRMKQRGLLLMLDLVPNHMAPDHPWVETHPDYFIRGCEADLVHSPENFMWVKRNHDELIFAHGRDPYFPGWPDTIQLNYGNQHLQQAMKQELLSIAAQCDGVRCDMAMLLLPEVFHRTWGISIEDFWPDAIRGVKKNYPGFLFLGEVYWDLEWTMMQQGFDFTYDKRLYDRLMSAEAMPVRDHLTAGIVYQNRLARFLENHDEQRIAFRLPWEIHQAAALITFLTPGMKFFHEGQLNGWRIKISPHLGRRPAEKTDPEIHSFYTNLLTLLKRPVFHEGDWTLLSCSPAWEGNPSHEQCIAFQWKTKSEQVLVIINFASTPCQCFVLLPPDDHQPPTLTFRELLKDTLYERDTEDLRNRGLYIDLPPWGYHLFDYS